MAAAMGVKAMGTDAKTAAASPPHQPVDDQHSGHCGQELGEHHGAAGESEDRPDRPCRQVSLEEPSVLAGHPQPATPRCGP
jgi:hypothetical protein